MKKAELIKYFKTRFPAVNEGGRDWRFTLIDDDTGYAFMYPKLGGPSYNQNIGTALGMNPRWFEEMGENIFEVGVGSYLFTTGDRGTFRCRFEKGDGLVSAMLHRRSDSTDAQT